MGGAGGITDPLNRFNRCEDFGSECTISRTACAADGECTGGTGDVCRPRFEAATCYDDRATVFACPAASHVYQYRAIGGSGKQICTRAGQQTHQRAPLAPPVVNIRLLSTCSASR